MMTLCAPAALGLALLIVSPAAAVHAQEAPPAAPVYRDLPGVDVEDPLGMKEPVICDQVLVDRAKGNILPQRGPRYQAVNVCRRGVGPEFVSPKLPPSIYRQLRGFNY